LLSLKPTYVASASLEGIAKAKGAGIYKGRPASIDAAKVHELKAQGVVPSEITKRLNVGCAARWRSRSRRYQQHLLAAYGRPCRLCGLSIPGRLVRLH